MIELSADIALTEFLAHVELWRAELDRWPIPADEQTRRDYDAETERWRALAAQVQSMRDLRPAERPAYSFTPAQLATAVEAAHLHVKGQSA